MNIGHHLIWQVSWNILVQCCIYGDMAERLKLTTIIDGLGQRVSRLSHCDLIYFNENDKFVFLEKERDSRILFQNTIYLSFLNSKTHQDKYIIYLSYTTTQLGRIQSGYCSWTDYMSEFHSGPIIARFKKPGRVFKYWYYENVFLK